MAKSVATGKKKAAAPARPVARKAAAPAARPAARPAAPVARTARVRPDPPRSTQATTQRRVATAADIPGTSEHAARHARRQQAITRASPGIKVRAKQDGYYGHIRRRAGDVFVIRKEEEFSKKWMEVVGSRERDRMTLSNEIIRKKHDETLALKYGGRASGGGNEFDEGDEGDQGDLDGEGDENPLDAD